jgi:BirA family biotin operon repressor/biotin-[acetyl-CoA-carboxylase] ligase
MGTLGTPRVHLRQTDSTNLRARALALAGAPHGTLVTAAEQSAGRGRQGRTWSAPPGRALLCSLVLREPPPLLPLAAGVAVAETVDALSPSAGDAAQIPRVGDSAQIKWPNDVLIGTRKVAGILVEGRPQEHWTVLGIGLNVALRAEDFPAELRDRAATLGLEPDAVEPALAELLARLERWLSASADEVLAGVRARDALLGQPIGWADGAGTGAGIDTDGRLLVAAPGSPTTIALDAGEVHLTG